MTPAATMQSVILALQDFWTSRGCLIWQPYYTQVGAGTMNPATFLRVLGPEPWRVAYVEPSVRPDDARFGENPNRLQQHYQFQVILKPDPGDPQEQYLESLAAIGLDLARHDIRFVEDKWESPALGAWGLGWEVWLDGQEITQFTYFQQAGGQALDPVSVEITYGLERILIGMLSLDHFKDIPWNGSRSYGDVLLAGEVEHSRYYLEQADVGRLGALFTLNEEEARAALERGLVLPAYDHLLRCSHLFNALDARGAVGVTERAALFGRMRALSRAVAERYVEQRRALEFPWLSEATPGAGAIVDESTPPPSGPEDFVLEVGTEELPAGDVSLAVRSLQERAPALLAEHGLEHGGVRAAGTPRRLVVEVDRLAARQAETVETVKGPPEARAFDGDGWPTPAARGWARKFGLDAGREALRAMVAEIDGGRYLVAQVRRSGEAASEVLARHVLPRLVGGIEFEQTMRWIGVPGEAAEAVALRRTAFARPIRWIVALHGAHLVPFEFAGLRAGRRTRGLRLREPEAITLDDAATFAAALAEAGVVLDPAERRRAILEQVDALARQVGGRVAPDEALLEEVANQVEAPHAVRGAFDPAFLSAPPEVLVAVMKKHQRYFPVEDKAGRLMPYFIAVRNGDGAGLDTVRAGNEHVLRARFADALFFLRKDRQGHAEHFRSKTALLTFQRDLGSMLDKSERMKRLVLPLSEEVFRMDRPTRAHAVRAAELCKADLATAIVTEMTSLQGVIGRIYAREWWGEPEAVAQAIFEHYLPRFAGDALPESAAGAAVGVADRLDTLAGLFAVGLQPTGARDPFALRRTAIGLVQILVSRGLRFDLEVWLRQAGAWLGDAFSEDALRACLEFIAARQEALLLAEGYRHDVVTAVLAAQGHDPAGAARAAAALTAAIQEPDWLPVLQAYARCARIVRNEKVHGVVDPRRLSQPEERTLFAALENTPRPIDSVPTLVGSLRALVPPITAFFDEVLVMDPDAKVRADRLALVQRVVELADGIADLSKLEGF